MREEDEEAGFGVPGCKLLVGDLTHHRYLITQSRILDDGGDLFFITLIAAYQYQPYRTLKLRPCPAVYTQQPLLAFVASQPPHA